MTEIFNKYPLKICRIDTNQYFVEAKLSYKKIDIVKLLEFNSLHILKNLNQDIIENIFITIIDNNFASLFIEYKHFLKDFGFAQFAVDLMVERVENNDIIEFLCRNNTIAREIDKKCTILPIDNLFVRFHILTSSEIKIIIDSKINIHFDIPIFIEKFIIRIIHKMFIRLKEFIEIV